MNDHLTVKKISPGEMKKRAVLLALGEAVDPSRIRHVQKKEENFE